MGYDSGRRVYERPPPEGGDLSAQIASGPPPASDTTKDQGPKPLGVPKDYRVPYTITQRPAYTASALEHQASVGQAQGDIITRGPQYFEGDQWKPAAISPASVSAIQRSLATAGLLDNFHFGVWDEKTADAYAKVLGYANAAGITDQMALQQMVESPEISMGGSGSGSGGGQGGRTIIGFDENGDPIFSQYTPPPLELRTTNRDDLKKMFRQLSSERLGVPYNDAQLNELVDAYNWQEVRVQKSNYDQQTAMERTAFEQGPQATAGQTFTTEQAPSPETFAENQMIAKDPTGYHAAQVGLTAVDQFEQALSRWR